MPNTNSAPLQAAAVQQTDPVCRTRQHFRRSVLLLYLVILVVGIAASAAAYAFFKPAVLDHPAFDPDALEGLPTVHPAFAYSDIKLADDFVVKLCGVPANDGQTVEFNLTNPKGNKVWLRAEILDEKGRLLGASGVLRQGQYLPSITLDAPLTQRDTPVTVKIISYEPDTWRSKGNVNLNLTLYLRLSL